MKKITDIVGPFRDLIFFLLLIVIVITILDRNGAIYKRQVRNLYSVHAVDPYFLEQTNQCKRHIQTLLTMFDSSEVCADAKHKLLSLEKDTELIYSAYEKNSPALAPLGPLGTTAIVMKEQELEKKLLATINETGAIIHTLLTDNEHSSQAYEPAASIKIGLHNNQANLKRVHG